VLRGVGNIYADESLWRAKIHPAKIAATLTRQQVKNLHRALQQILQKAILLRGSSISNFVDSDGAPGEYQQHHRAYGREGEKCYRCRAVICRAIVAGRSSFFCPKCQSAPRGFAALPLPRRQAQAKRKRPTLRNNSQRKRARKAVIRRPNNP
jgi:formamidopyrimidine-DNA glycosylase